MPAPLNPADLSPVGAKPALDPKDLAPVDAGKPQGAGGEPADQEKPGESGWQQAADFAMDPLGMGRATQGFATDPKDAAVGAVRGTVKGVVQGVAFPYDLAVMGERLLDPALRSLSGATGTPLGHQYGTSGDYADKLLDRFLPQTHSDVGKAIETGTGIAAAGAGAELRTIGRAVRQLTSTATRVTSRAANQAMAQGWKLSPAYIGGDLEKQLQTFRSTPKLHEDMSAFNENVTDNVARHDLGLTPDSELNESTYDALRTENYKPYEEARALTPNPTDKLAVVRDAKGNSAYLDAIKAVGKRYVPSGGSFGRSEFADIIDPLKAQYATESFNVGEAIDHARLLRQLARSNLKAYDVKANALGYAQREIATAIDQEVARMAEKPMPQLQISHQSWKTPPPTVQPNPGLGQRLTAARKALAKIQTYEDATGAGGHIIAEDLVRLSDKGVPLEGGAQAIARAAKNFPKDFKPIAGAGKGERGRWSAVDYLLGGTGLVLHEPLVAGASLVRPAFGAALKSERWQQRMLRAHQEKAGLRTPTAGERAWRTVRRGAAKGAGIQATDALGGSITDMDTDVP